MAISLLNRLHHVYPGVWNARRLCLKAICDTAGRLPAERLSTACEAAGYADQLVFSPAFQDFLGGPKYLSEDPQEVYIRKYVGIEGVGDFTLLFYFPTEVLTAQEIVHSHEHPERFHQNAFFQGYSRFATIRSPADSLTAASFSINALAGHYLHLRQPGREAELHVRRELALHKLTDLNFFRGLVEYHKSYLETFLSVREHFHTIRYEEITRSPASVIKALASAAGRPIGDRFAVALWDEKEILDASATHTHNIDPGAETAHVCAAALTNKHLAILRELGVAQLEEELGYPPRPDFDPKAYTPFQHAAAQYLREGRVHTPDVTSDLFRFAFNKSNLRDASFAFRHYQREGDIRIDRADMQDEALLFRLTQAAADGLAVVRRLFASALVADYTTESGRADFINDVAAILKDMDDRPRLAEACLEGVRSAIATIHTPLVNEVALKRLFGASFTPHRGGEPRLIRTLKDANIVQYGGILYRIPHALGPIDLKRQSPLDFKNVRCAVRLTDLDP